MDTLSTIMDDEDIPVDPNIQQKIWNNPKNYSLRCILNIGKDAKEVEYLFNMGRRLYVRPSLLFRASMPTRIRSERPIID
jgi:hypothetical protein